MAMRGSERPQIESEKAAKQATGPRDNLKVLFASLIILVIVGAILFLYFGVFPGGTPTSVDKG